MSKIPEIFRYDLEAKAINFIQELDTKGALLNKKDALYHTKEFLREKIKNPVGMAIAMKDILKESPIEDVFEWSSNLAFVEKDPEVKTLLKKLATTELNYKKTSDLRQKLIDLNRVNNYEVSPALRGFDKLKLRFKLLFS